jgi:hypothetical protein
MNTWSCRLSPVLLLPVLATVPAFAVHQLTDPTVAELAEHFARPPAAYSSQVTWGWSGVITREVIARDLDKLQAMNLQQAWVEPGRNPEAPYLSAAYFENVKIAVEEAKRRGMHLWFDDDGGYPSGFAGGKITTERPDLAMKALAEPEQVAVAPGETFTRALDDKTICVVATNLDTGATQLLEPRAGQVGWTAPATGRWVVALAKWKFRSGVTRSANNKSGAKDGEHALMDYLSPEANRAFADWTFEAYARAVGDEFGKTFLGFRGDEAAFGFNPWTPDFPAEFQRRKGYDLRPWLPAVAAIEIGHARASAAPVAGTLDPAHRAYADYCDVWSDLFGEKFFAGAGAWGAAHGLEMQAHIEHEEILPQLALANGDYFKCMRGLQIPGVDVIWHQVWHDVVADFPKLASSSAHLNGHPLSMSETFAAMSGRYPTPDLEECGWILHHQAALGITHFEYMFMPASTPRSRPAGPGQNPGSAGASPPSASAPARGVAPAGYRYLNDPKFPGLALEVNRLTYLLAQGRPAAEIGVYIPSSSFWFGDTAANQSFVTLVHALLEAQRDVDFIDDGSLARTLELKDGALVNLSGQGYRAIVVPQVVAISQAALDKLRAFARAGGRVFFLGSVPQLVMDGNFLDARPPGNLGWAALEKSAGVTPQLLAALPVPDVALDQPAPGLKYNHRHLKDGEAYYLFNEGDAPLKLRVTLSHAGRVAAVQDWDTRTGEIRRIAGAGITKSHATVPLELAPWEARLLVLAPR